MDDTPIYPSYESTHVIICGCGPTGAILSAHLGRANVTNIVLEKQADISTDPRGIALDEDGIRALQSVGIYNKVYSEIGRCLGAIHFISGTQQRLNKAPFLRINFNTTEGGTGHVGGMSHKQPALEANLRLAMKSTSNSSLRVGSTMTSISEDDDWVYVTYDDEQGIEHRLKSRFLVGADGKTGFTRKKYLEPRGIRMEQASLTSYQEIWVALNWKMILPTPQTHPEFPLWRLGYTPEQVYDLFFPQEFRFLCNPNRPAVCGRFGLPEDRLWRFEFVVQGGEDGMQMATPEKVKDIVYPYIIHAGSHYGLPEDVRYPNDCIEVLRSRPFWFSARSCNKWARNRVILRGDSAHVFPPFGGQGIASGFRDAGALAWRLQVACRPGFMNYQALFTGWYTERKQQLERSIAATVANGNRVCERNWLKILLRDTVLWLIQLVPSWKHWLELGPRQNGMVRYEFEPGMTFLPKMGGGACFPQVYCVPLHSSGFDEDVESVAFTDDVIFASHKRGLFQVAILLDSDNEIQDAQAALADVDRLSDGEIFAEEATFIVQDIPAGPTVFEVDSKSPLLNFEDKSMNLFRLASASVFAQSRLCLNRPAPQYFDEYRIKKDLKGKKFVVLRPDRFVFAACTDKRELDEAVRQIPSILNGHGSKS